MWTQCSAGCTCLRCIERYWIVCCERLRAFPDNCRLYRWRSTLLRDTRAGFGLYLWGLVTIGLANTNRMTFARDLLSPVRIHLSGELSCMSP